MMKYRGRLRVWLAAGMAVSAGLGCAIAILPDFDPSTTASLDTVTAAITITQQAGSGQASASADLIDANGLAVVLGSDQSVQVNDIALTGPNSDDAYSQTITAATQYTVTVTEPTRGVSQTTIDAPGDFEITSPAAGEAASLSGFTLNWSNPDAALMTRVRISQTLFGEESVATFGPFADSGTVGLTNEDLALFQQGADLTITVARVRSLNSVGGFASGTLDVILARSTDATPGP